MNYIKFTLPFIFVFYGSNSFADSKKSSLVGFKNIPWNTHISAVSKKIGKSKIINQCEVIGDKKLTRELMELAKNDNTSCSSIFIDSYVISGFKFSVDLQFNKNDLLNKVLLSYVPPNLQNTEDEFNDCNSAYLQISNLLEIKYGESFSVKNGNPHFRYENFDMAVWVLMPTEIWVRKSYNRKPPKDFLRSCVVEINYSPRISDDADKL